jgi:hypothetical protein
MDSLADTYICVPTARDVAPIARFGRHLSRHVGVFVMADRTVIQWRQSHDSAARRVVEPMPLAQ